MSKLAHKIRLAPNAKQERYFKQACGTARFIYNWGLAEWNKRKAAGEKPTSDVLKRHWNAIKSEKYPWALQTARDTNSQPFRNLQTAFVKFFNKTGGYPVFKKKGKSKDAFYIANDKIRVEGKKVRIPVIGWVRMREELRFAGKINSAVVSREADQWHISISVEVPVTQKPRSVKNACGIDLGINKLAVIHSDTGTQVVLPPKPLDANLDRLIFLSKRLSRKIKGSKNRRKAAVKVARLHLRIKNVRKDAIHKLTSTVINENQVIAIEDLNVNGMMRNRKVARAVSDRGFTEVRRQLAYKALIVGATVHTVDRFYPSSKTCSGCDRYHKEWVWGMTIVRCECGLEMDRDINAAINLYRAGKARINACGAEEDGGTGKYLRSTSRTVSKQELKKVVHF